VAENRNRNKNKTLNKGGEKHEKTAILEAERPDTNQLGLEFPDATNDENGKANSEADGRESTEANQVHDVGHAVIGGGWPLQPDISPFVTNPEGNVYCVTNLPEEFVAVLFAWVSRSPKSFKDHLRKAIQDGLIPETERPAWEKLSEKATAFHEKFVVQYGHSSVAEHANSHIGIEKISRLASAELELSNEFFGITEYSQRYQQPSCGDWFNPFEKGGKQWQVYEDYMLDCFNVYLELKRDILHDLMLKANLHEMTEAEGKKAIAAFEKMAFEDARYALPLAMYTQLGMTGNGRSWRDSISKLYGSRYEEVHQLADDLKGEISKVLPTLLRHADPSEYERRRHNRFQHRFQNDMKRGTDYPVQLLSPVNEKEMITSLIAQVMVENEQVTYNEAYHVASTMPDDWRKETIGDLIWEMASYDVPPDSFKQVHFQFSFTVSEANCHQLLRHNRKTAFTFRQPSVKYGLTIPPRIKAAGVEGKLLALAQKAERYYNELSKGIREYVVLNAHGRHVIASFNLWEAYHLINLRTSEEAQWEIRDTFEQVYRMLQAACPTLIAGAKRR
jgi:thymidylate synthase ThyX